MVAWRYEISLLVLKKYFTRSLRSLVKYFSTREEKFRISARLYNILYIIIKVIHNLRSCGSLTIPRAQRSVSQAQESHEWEEGRKAARISKACSEYFDHSFIK